MDIEQIKKKLDFDGQVSKYLALGGRRVNLVDWDFLNIYAQLRPDREALMDVWADRPRRYTFKQILDLTNLVVFSLLDLGIKKGDIAFVQLPNMAELWYLRVAFSKIGVIEARIGENYRETEIAHRLKALKPNILIIPSEFRGFDYVALYREIFRSVYKPKHIFVIGKNAPEGMRPFSDLTNPKLSGTYSYLGLDLLKTHPNENYVISFTGGTTGSPKSILQSSFYSGGGAVAMQVIENGDINTNDKILALAPLAGATGTNMCYFTPIYSGASVVFLPHVDIELALKLTKEENVTIWAGIPTYAIRLLTSPHLAKYNVKSVRLWIGSGARMPLEFGERLYNMGIKMVNSYGVVDGSIATRTCIHDTKEKMINTVGKPIRGLVVKIIDDNGNEVPPGEKGEIMGMAVHGGDLINAETCDISISEAWDQNGFFHTGDLGSFDEDGYLKVIDRKKDMILRGAQNIFPSEIEGLLLKHPNVTRVAVIGMPDRELGERVCAYVVPKEGKSFTFDEMMTYFKKQNIAKYKFPERLEIVDSLPLSHGGKYSKLALKNDIIQKLKNEGKI